MNTFHLAISQQHGTPVRITSLVNTLFNGDVLDVCSSEAFNRIHNFRHYFDESVDGLTQDWGKYSNNVFCNPPGREVDPVTKKQIKKGLTKEFWDKANSELEAGNINYVFWVGYSNQQLQTLQNTKYQFRFCKSICLVNKRLKYLDETGKPQESPLQASWLGLLVNPHIHPDDTLYIRFQAIFSEFGVMMDK